MAKATIAGLQREVTRLTSALGAADTDKHNKDLALTRLRTNIETLKTDLAAEQANKHHAHILAAQMQGFIRAHHTEKRPTGVLRQEYNTTTGNYDQIPEMLDVYPFMELEF
jgi:hypothetical protein